MKDLDVFLEIRGLKHVATRQAWSNEVSVFRVSVEFGACITYLATEPTMPYCLTLNPFPHIPKGFEFATLLCLSELLKSLYQVLTSSNPSGYCEEKVWCVIGCKIVDGKSS